MSETTNPNPSGHFSAEDSDPPVAESSGPVGLGPQEQNPKDVHGYQRGTVYLMRFAGNSEEYEVVPVSEYRRVEAERDARVVNSPLAGITNEELVRRAVRGAKNLSVSTMPRWYVISELFGLGSTYATHLCHFHGLDPHEQMPRGKLVRE